MAKKPGVSKQYLRFLLKTCNGIAPYEDENMTEKIEVFFHPFETFVMLYPRESRAHLQVHLLFNGDVQIHQGEDHVVIGRFTTADFLDVFPQDDFTNEVCAHIADWIAVSTLFPSKKEV